ncbi:caspase family protein [Stieleria varia]|nr:caspase family protein [Stieleria varia]
MIFAAVGGYSPKASAQLPQTAPRATDRVSVADDRCRFALLIGINQYPKLKASEQLRGCLNDVELMRQLLTVHSGFEDESIVTLTDAQATREGITRELDLLQQRVLQCNRSGKAAQVVLHYSGHGSQVLDQMSGPLRDEPNFYDQTLVPYDAEKVGGEKDIRDDQLHQWACDIAANPRNRLFVVLDCCHSGTGLRGLKRYRRLDRTLPSPQQDRFAPIARPAALPVGAAVISACRSDQLEPEYDADGEPYGLLTYWVCRIATQNATATTVQLDKLSDELKRQYKELAKLQTSPEPQLEMSGAIATSNVLFVRPASERRFAPIVIGSSGDVTVNAGILDSVRVGDRFPVLDSLETTSGAAVGEIEFTRVGVSQSRGLITWSGNQQPPTKNGFWCEIRPASASSDSLSIALTNSQGESPDEILRQLPELRHSQINYVGQSSQTQHSIHLDDRQMVISRVISHASAEDGSSTSHVIARDGTFASKAQELVQRLVATEQFASMLLSENRTSQESEPLQVELVVGGIVDGQYKFSPVTPAADGLPTLKTGDVYALQISDPRARSRLLYASVIHIDPAFEMAVMCPTEFTATDPDQQRISMPDGLLTRSFVCNGDSLLPRNHPDFKAPQDGVHRALIIVSDQPPNLSQLFRVTQRASGTKTLGSKSISKPKDPWWTAKLISWKSE